MTAQFLPLHGPWLALMALGWEIIQLDEYHGQFSIMAYKPEDS